MMPKRPHLAALSRNTFDHIVDKSSESFVKKTFMQGEKKFLTQYSGPEHEAFHHNLQQHKSWEENRY